MIQFFFHNIKSTSLTLIVLLVCLPTSAENKGETEKEKNSAPVNKLVEPNSHLEGHIQQSGDATTHIHRPLAPAATHKPQGKADKALSAVKSLNFDLQAKSLNAKADSNSSLFKQTNGAKDQSSRQDLDNKPIPGSIEAKDLPYDEDLGDQTINWEPWHKRFIESLYVIFHRANNGSAPGSARILIHVRKDGALAFEAGRDFYAQSAQFRNLLERSIKMLSHSASLEFPDGSRREEVQFTMTIKSSAESGKSSYGWTKGDFEKQGH